MIDFKILEKFGTTKNRIREVMTAELGTKDWEHRDRLENEFEDKVQEGILFNLRNHEVYTSADLAWDGNIISKQTIPLTLFAQGRIDIKQFVAQCKECGLQDEDIERFCEKDEDTKEFKDPTIGKFIEVAVNMVRSYVQRRHAAQDSKYLSQYPFLKYETYSRSYEAQLLADITSQRMEIMSNDFGYKHQLSQIIRDFLLYPHVVEFAECAWKTEKQYKMGEDDEPIPVITKEGVPFTAPHPSRVFWDISSPLSSINSDSGCDYIGYWEVKRFDSLSKNTMFWNRDSIDYTGKFDQLTQTFNPYFSIYYPDIIDIPDKDKFSIDPASMNDRENNIGVYNVDEHARAPMVVTCFYKKLIPKDYGFGSYPYPVWVRFVLAGEKTCIYAEVMPDCPAQYYGYNEKDNRLFNISFAHEIMPWQDQMSNLVTQLLLTMKGSLLKVLAVNIGQMEPEAVKYIRKVLSGDTYATKPVVLEYDADKNAAMGVSNESINLQQANQSQNISDGIRAIIELTAVADRMLNLSPQELGQPSPRVASATEILEIANTVNTLYNFVSKAIDAGLSAKKRYLYKATVALQQGEIYLSVMGTYPDHIIEKAGFEPENDSTEDGKVKNQMVRGKASSLIYNYVFNSREGSDRTPSVKVAEILVQLLPQVLQIPGIMEGLGNEKVYELVNAIMRNAGAGIEFKLSALEESQEAQARVNQTVSEEQQVTDNETMLNAVDQISQMLGQIVSKTEEQDARIEELQAVADAILGGADRRARGQRFEGGPEERVTGQPTAPSIPQAVIEPEIASTVEDPFQPTEQTPLT